MLDPSLSEAVVRVAPYPNMLCGDKLVLRWEGLDAEGVIYRHEVFRSVSEELVGQEIVFVIKGVHVATLERGSLQVYWTLYSVAPLSSGTVRSFAEIMPRVTLRPPSSASMLPLPRVTIKPPSSMKC